MQPVAPSKHRDAAAKYSVKLLHSGSSHGNRTVLAFEYLRVVFEVSVHLFFDAAELRVELDILRFSCVLEVLVGLSST